MFAKTFAPAMCAASALALVAGLSMTSAAAQTGDGFWQGVQKAGTLRCGAAIDQPYVMRNPATGEYSGFFADLCREFAEVLKVKPVFVDTTWDNIVAGLQAGKWDVSLALSRTPARAMAINFSAPAMEYQTSFVYNKNNTKIPEGLVSFADLDKKDLTFVVMSGTSQDKTVSEAIKNARILRLPSTEETRMALVSRRADVLVAPSDTNAIFAGINPDWAVLFNPTPALAEYGVGFGLPRHLSYSDVQVANIFIEQLRAAGKVKSFIDKATAEVIAGQ
ncbi:substrate-binding periplasmic protein [Pseudochelatococcus contaminans]|uniref:Polar amino acid transport system substrate-binding protein n=1 Tax=Pseudochelatococcus contaminans TaxID=1538103 RepID=A0A7W5Z578_9HYPH|nr:transporter substrate-binding domain-containing protein [Pseudochelatococcus contaminans]MBB3810415.1 polar amino acid transport system substrate-binding protein [Pseudochelatococcus contaminans]